MLLSVNERQKQIIEAAIPLFLEEGVGVSTARIAQAAGVSNGSLFNAFATKQELIDAIYFTTKSGMYSALTHRNGARFDRANLYQSWCDYLSWARRRPQHRKVMHLLLDAGLASKDVKAKVAKLALPNDAWLSEAYERGIIRGPSVAYVGKLALFQLDLVVDEKLEGEDEKLAFDMLCQSIGLPQ